MKNRSPKSMVELMNKNGDDKLASVVFFRSDCINQNYI